MMINKLELSNFDFNVAIRLRQRCSEIKKEGNQMPPVNSFDDFSPWADSTETISRLDTILYKMLTSGDGHTIEVFFPSSTGRNREVAILKNTRLFL